MKENYIQHNLAYGTGAEAFYGSVEYLGPAPVKTTVNTIRAFEDGDKVFMQTVYNFAGAGEQVAFDIFCFEDGLIAERWDNLATKAQPNPSGRTQIDGQVEAKDLEKTEENREIVKNFLYDVMQGKNPQKTPDYFDGGKYLQHNTGIADGLSGLGAALEALAKAGIAMIYDKVHQVLAQGDMVLAVSEGTFGGDNISNSGYYITDKCIGGGKCLSVCPQNCITIDGKATIRQENCLHCGNCQKVCTVDAVIRK